jgi:hypothetical protein
MKDISEVRNLFVAIALALIGLFLSASNGTAGKFMDECDGVVAEDAQELAVNRMRCYFEKMNDIRYERDKIGHLIAIATKIRGTEEKGTETEYSCGRIYSTVEKVKFKVSGGICSDLWNNWINSRSRYLRLSCEQHYGDLDKEVSRNRSNAEMYEQKYMACFTENIPEEDARMDPRLKDHKSYTAYMAQEIEKFKTDQMAEQFLELRNACDALLTKIHKQRPDLIEANDLRCKE